MNLNNGLNDLIIFAAQKHAGQMRKDGHNGVCLPYIVHPIQVLARIFNWGISHPLVLRPSVFHDMREDTSTTYEELVDFCGREEADIVEELTFDPSKGRKELYLSRFDKASVFAIVIKVSDRLCNVEDFLRNNPQYARKYFLKAVMLFSAAKYREVDLIATFGKEQIAKMFTDINDVNTRTFAADILIIPPTVFTDRIK